MRLVIAEKPSVAMALASVIGARSRRDGFVEGNGYLVSWCVGHLVGLCDAADYSCIQEQIFWLQPKRILNRQTGKNSALGLQWEIMML